MSKGIAVSAVQTASTAGGTGGAIAGRVDGYSDRIVKYIPADAVDFWQCISG